MQTLIRLSVFLIILSGCSNAQEMPSEYEKNWPQWRGPYATGTVPDANPPLEWNEGRNIKWKTEIPGRGHATPVIWGDRVIVLSAVQTEEKVETGETSPDQEQVQWMTPVSTDYIHEFVVLLLDRKTGKIIWQTTVRRELPHSSTHEFGSWASNSPVTDGEHIYAYFGSHGLYCLNYEGQIIWERDLGRMEKVMSFGEGSSPVLFEDKLIVLRDHQGPSFLHVLDKKTGTDILKIGRDEISSWSTPLIVEHGGQVQLVTSATNKVRSYDPASGNVVWECTGMTRNVIPSPVSAGGMVYLMSGFRGSAVLAVDLSKARGDISGTDAIVWKYDQNTPYTPSPVLMDGKLYFLKVNNGYLSCLDAADGKVFYTNQKLEGIDNIFSSPVGAGDRIYIAGTGGTFCVLKHGPEFELLAQNKLEDSFYASPAIKGNTIYLRGTRYLYAVSAD